MSYWDSDKGSFGETGSGLPTTAAVRRSLASFLLVATSITAAGSHAFSQSPSPTPAQEEGAVVEKTVPTGQPDRTPVASPTPPKDDKEKQKSEKRGSFIS